MSAPLTASSIQLRATVLSPGQQGLTKHDGLGAKDVVVLLLPIQLGAKQLKQDLAERGLVLGIDQPKRMNHADVYKSW